MEDLLAAFPTATSHLRSRNIHEQDAIVNLLVLYLRTRIDLRHQLGHPEHFRETGRRFLTNDLELDTI